MLQCLQSTSQVNLDNDTIEKRFTKFDLSSIPVISCDGEEAHQILTSLINFEDVTEDQSHINRKSKKISNDQELIQSDPISCPQNQKGNN